MEQTPADARFERIEKAQETTAKALATLAAESTSAFGNINATQRHMLDLIKQHDYRFTALARVAESLIEVQTLQGKSLENLADSMTALVAAQAKRDLVQAETQGKLAALIDMWGRSIRERGGKNGAPEPPPA